MLTDGRLTSPNMSISSGDDKNNIYFVKEKRTSQGSQWGDGSEGISA